MGVPALVRFAERCAVVPSDGALVDVLALARVVVEGVAGAAGGDPDARVRAHRVVAALGTAIRSLISERWPLIMDKS